MRGTLRRRQPLCLAAVAAMAICVLARSASATGGAGQSVQSIGASDPDPAKMAFAKCLCAIIDGDALHPKGCLPASELKDAKALKAAGCLKIATEAELTVHFEAQMTAQNNAQPAGQRHTPAQVHQNAVNAAKDKVNKGGAFNSADGKNPWATYVWPSKIPGNDYRKKASVFDECHDLSTRASADPALGFPGPYAAHIMSIFDDGSTVYVNLQSVIAALDFLDSIKPTAPGADLDAWWAAYWSEDAYLAVLIGQMCAVLDALKEYGITPGSSYVCAALAACKASAMICRLTRTGPALVGRGKRPYGSK